MSTENNHIFQQWVFVCFCVCLHFACSFVITFIASHCSDNMNIQGMFRIGKWSNCLFQSCSLRPTLNFSSYIQSCWVHILAIFTSVHARMHWHDSKRYTAISYSSPKSYALAVTVVAVQCWKHFCTKTCISLHICCTVSWIICQFPYIDIEKFWVFALAAGAAVEDWSLLGCDTLSLGK